MKIVTDSGADLSYDQCQALGVEMVPLKVSVEGKTYLSGVDLLPDAFYDLLDKTDEMPITSTPSIGEFVEVYERVAKIDPEILSIHISSGLSGTFSTAVTAANMVKNAKITLVDTLTLSAGMAWQLEAAVKALKGGLPLEKILSLVKQIQQASTGIFTLPELKYLIAGGRISHLKGLLASVLGIKPIIRVSNTDGKYYDVGKKRSFLKAIEAIPEIISKGISQGTKVRTQLCHAGNLDGGQFLVNAMNAMFDCDWLPPSSIGTALGAHTGRGMVGVIVASQSDYPAIG